METTDQEEELADLTNDRIKCLRSLTVKISDKDCKIRILKINNEARRKEKVK